MYLGHFSLFGGHSQLAYVEKKIWQLDNANFFFPLSIPVSFKCKHTQLDYEKLSCPKHVLCMFNAC